MRLISYTVHTLWASLISTPSFINESERIASKNYFPTDDDVVRARLRTLGVQEYKFIFDHGGYLFFLDLCYMLMVNSGRTVGQEWRIYDVGGTRSIVR